MPSNEVTIPTNYWESFKIEDGDIEFIFNHLLELETPLTSNELLSAIVDERISREKILLTKALSDVTGIYRPKDKFNIGQELVFESSGNRKGIIQSIRKGVNPELPPFEVIDVEFDNHEIHSFAGSLEDHKLNTPQRIKNDDPNLDKEYILRKYGEILKRNLTNSLQEKKDLVLIAGRWFPRSLLVDVNQGHLNLAEAILEEAGGGPLPISKIIDQAELPKGVNPQLIEFSLDLALQEDTRFDEVGPAGETLWFLKRLEPEGVQKQPYVLNFSPVEFDQVKISHLLVPFETHSTDEYEPGNELQQPETEIEISLIYPHWTAGTLPLTNHLQRLFPYAHEAPRIRFTFIDTEKGQQFNGWVVQPQRYIYGLKTWYQEQGLIPGSIIHLKSSKEPGVIGISIEKRRQNREWIRTALIGSDGCLVFAMLKQPVTAAFDERMSIYVPEPVLLEQIWERKTYQKMSLDQVVIQMMRELVKLNPQGQIHAQELYAVVNLVRRCPPGPILSILSSSEWSSYLGDSYFRLQDKTI